MDQRSLGRTGLRVSALGFGCGAIGGLFVKGTAAEQRQAFEEARAGGISYFDTAASYGDRLSETNLGRVLAETGGSVSVGTKVRVDPGDLRGAAVAVRDSLETSLRLLRRDRVDLFQLHNHIGLRRDEANGTLAVEDVLGPVADAFRMVKDAGLTDHIGITGLGQMEAVHRIVTAGVFESTQTYFNALNPSAGYAGQAGPGGQDFEGLIDRAAGAGLGVIVIRPLAAGAVSGQEERHSNAGDPGKAIVPGADYEENRRRASSLEVLAGDWGLDGPVELALRFALAKPGISTVLVGYSNLGQLRSALRWAERGSLSSDQVARVLQLS